MTTTTPQRSRKLTNEHRAVLQAANALRLEKRRQRRSGALAVGGYRVWQLDEWNWALQHGEDENSRRYYPDLPTALIGLLHLRIGEHVHTDLTNVQTAIAIAKREILAAIGGAP